MCESCGPSPLPSHSVQENISNFLAAAEKYGLRRTDLFQTVDLYEEQNLTAVVNTLHMLGAMAQKNGFSGPVLGPKIAGHHVREPAHVREPCCEDCPASDLPC
jgi:transgelin